MLAGTSALKICVYCAAGWYDISSIYFVTYLGCTFGLGIKKDGKPWSLPASCPPPTNTTVDPDMTPKIRLRQLKKITVNAWSKLGILFHTNSVKYRRMTDSIRLRILKHIQICLENGTKLLIQNPKSYVVRADHVSILTAIRFVIISIINPVVKSYNK